MRLTILTSQTFLQAVQKSLQKRASTREDAVASTSNLDEVVDELARFLVFVTR